MNRRRFLQGMAGILASGSAPWVCTTAGVLMPVRGQIARPDEWLSVNDVRGLWLCPVDPPIRATAFWLATAVVYPANLCSVPHGTTHHPLT
jgi:hypothetical protein